MKHSSIYTYLVRNNDSEKTAVTVKSMEIN